jgi:hypothetical protein
MLVSLLDDVSAPDPANRIRKNQFSSRLLKKVQMQGGLPEAGAPSLLGPDVLEVRRSERRGKTTPQMGLFQQPATPR